MLDVQSALMSDQPLQATAKSGPSLSAMTVGRTIYKFKRTIKLDDYSGASVDILVDENDHLSVRAVDLIGDAWHHFLEALARAEEFQRQRRTHDTNREVQLALRKLATHLDGVVCGMCECLKQRLSDFRPPEYGKRKDCTLAQKIDYLTAYVQEVRRLRLPTLDLKFKVFRDLLIHPYAKKSLPPDAEGKKMQIGQSDIFDVTVDDLKVAKSMVDGWLGAVTALFDYPRGYHTGRLAEDFAAKLLREYKRCGGALPQDDEIEVKTYRI